MLLVACAVPSCKSAGPSGGEPAAPPSRPDTEVTAPTTMNPVVQFETSLGSFELTLDAEAAPVTTMNFIDYIEDGYYEGTVFHRVVDTMMIQGGAFYATMHRKNDGLREPIISEWNIGLKNTRWTVGMVRRPGVIDSAQSEFYINLIDHPALDTPTDGAGYTVFGRVTDGFDTIERIRETPVGTHPRYAGGRSAVVPKTPVLIREARVLEPLDRPAAIARAEELEELRKNRVARLIEQFEARGSGKRVTSDSGLTYVDLVVGNGGVPHERSAVEVYYRGYFVDGVEFENAMREPSLLRIPDLTEGLREGILTMAEGGVRAMIIPPELAYGSGGIPGKIPPNATLVFEVELLQVK